MQVFIAFFFKKVKKKIYIGENIRVWRADVLKIGQGDLINRWPSLAGKSRQAISNLEIGKTRASVLVLIDFAEDTNLSYDTLLFKELSTADSSRPDNLALEADSHYNKKNDDIRGLLLRIEQLERQSNKDSLEILRLQKAIEEVKKMIGSGIDGDKRP